jgi:peptidoglycan/xylan/chitin deacetylase (PgdA/CDA1 family)
MLKNVSVCLSFDFDALSIWIGPMRSKSPSTISRGEFGVVGTERLLDVLRRHQVLASWFIPGHTIDTFPKIVRKIADSGHEIGHHGYLHENPASVPPDEERRLLERGIECIRRITGKAPAGYRSPAWDLSPHSVSLLLELGFQYDSSLMANDFTPYYCRVGDEAPQDGPYVFGKEVDLVELPVDWSLDDWPYFGLHWPAHHVGLRTPDEVYKIWAADFDFLYQRLGAGVYILTMHPQVIGRGHRILMLERLIEYMKGHEGVTFTTMEQAASAWRHATPLIHEKKEG